MGRKGKKCPKNCLRHHFNLKPVHYSAFFSRQSSLSFCPDNLMTQAYFPKFNRDRKHYTASFILASDQIKLQSNSEFYRLEHERYREQQDQQKLEIFIPKPRDKHNFCNVCKQQFDDYLNHIDSKIHKKIIENCPFDKDLKELCSKYFENGMRNQKDVNFEETHFSQEKRQINNENSQTIQSLFLQNHEIELPQLIFGAKSTRQNLQGLNFCKSIHSFHGYCENREGVKIENHLENHFQNYFLQHSLFKQIPQNCFMANNMNQRCFKVVDQTASPIKSKIGRPIILTNSILKLDE